jgi:hypothetical protein
VSSCGESAKLNGYKEFRGVAKQTRGQRQRFIAPLRRNISQVPLEFRPSWLGQYDSGVHSARRLAAAGWRRHVEISIVLERSRATGDAGVQNPLCFKGNMRMLFGDARTDLQSVLEALGA